MTPPSDLDPSRCRLLGPTALVVQALMGVLVITSLVIKRQLEKKRRPWRIWTWDVGKQLVGQGVIHLLNLLISDVVAHAAHNNPCSLYFLNVLIDTTVGVAIFYFALKGLTWFITQRLGLEGFQSGKYGNPPKPRFWWQQLIPYLISIILMKLLVLLPLTLPGISPLIIRLGHDLLAYLNPDAQVIFVMAIFPLIMNILQFCLVDQVIKAGQSDETPSSDDYQPLPTDQNHEPDIESQSSDLRRQITDTPGMATSHSTRTSSMPPTPLAPNSPLLSAVDDARKGGYGSTNPSPRHSLSNEAGDSFWAKFLRRESQFDEYDRARDKRSDAPSPDSFRPLELPPDEPETLVSPKEFMAMTGSGLSDEVQREARQSLSPKLTQDVRWGAAEESSVSLEERNG